MRARRVTKIRLPSPQTAIERDFPFTDLRNVTAICAVAAAILGAAVYLKNESQADRQHARAAYNAYLVTEVLLDETRSRPMLDVSRELSLMWSQLTTAYDETNIVTEPWKDLSVFVFDPEEAYQYDRCAYVIGATHLEPEPFKLFSGDPLSITLAIRPAQLCDFNSSMPTRVVLSFPELKVLGFYFERRTAERFLIPSLTPLCVPNLSCIKAPRDFASDHPLSAAEDNILPAPDPYEIAFLSAVIVDFNLRGVLGRENFAGTTAQDVREAVAEYSPLPNSFLLSGTPIAATYLPPAVAAVIFFAQISFARRIATGSPAIPVPSAASGQHRSVRKIRKRPRRPGFLSRFVSFSATGLMIAILLFSLVGTSLLLMLSYRATFLGIDADLRSWFPAIAANLEERPLILDITWFNHPTVTLVLWSFALTFGVFNVIGAVRALLRT